MSKTIGQDLHADRSICGWARCQATTDGHPICTTHLRKAWAIVHESLTPEQRRAAAETPEGAPGAL